MRTGSQETEAPGPAKDCAGYSDFIWPRHYSDWCRQTDQSGRGEHQFGCSSSVSASARYGGTRRPGVVAENRVGRKSWQDGSL